MAAASTKSDEEKQANKDATYANGFRAAREAKGYGRKAAAEALGITTSALWKLETAAEGKELASAIKELKALPQAEKPERKAPAKATATTKGTKAPAKKAAAKPKPAAATDLI